MRLLAGVYSVSITQPVAACLTIFCKVIILTTSCADHNDQLDSNEALSDPKSEGEIDRCWDKRLEQWEKLND